jgi:hypothetical protein
MLERYYKFQVDKFFEDYKDNQKRLERLKIELEDAIISFSTDYTVERVDNSNISNPTEMRATRRESIEGKIKELEAYFELHRYILSQLEPPEVFMVEKVLSVRGSRHKSQGVIRVKTALCIEQTTAYKQLNQLREKVAEIANWT